MNSMMKIVQKMLAKNLNITLSENEFEYWYNPLRVIEMPWNVKIVIDSGVCTGPVRNRYISASSIQMQSIFSVLSK